MNGNMNGTHGHSRTIRVSCRRERIDPELRQKIRSIARINGIPPLEMAHELLRMVVQKKRVKNHARVLTRH